MWIIFGLPWNSVYIFGVTTERERRETNKDDYMEINICLPQKRKSE